MARVRTSHAGFTLIELLVEFLKATDRMAKTIIFCENIDHAERMRQAMMNAYADLAGANSKW